VTRGYESNHAARVRLRAEKSSPMICLENHLVYHFAYRIAESPNIDTGATRITRPSESVRNTADFCGDADDSEWRRGVGVPTFTQRECAIARARRLRCVCSTIIWRVAMSRPLLRLAALAVILLAARASADARQLDPICETPYYECFDGCPANPNGECLAHKPQGCTYTNGDYTCYAYPACGTGYDRRLECPYTISGPPQCDEPPCMECQDPPCN
jgi:hypothetical protein